MLCAKKLRGGPILAARVCIRPPAPARWGTQIPVDYNVYFDSADVAVVRAIARDVRAAFGGLHGVKAMGMLAHGRAQLSMNITDFETTPVSQVYSTVSRLAQQAQDGACRRRGGRADSRSRL